MITDEEKTFKYGSFEEYNRIMAQKYLNTTDYVVIKMQEYQITGQTLDNDYTEILEKREEARNVLRSLSK